jgi:hypothetical protein
MRVENVVWMVVESKGQILIAFIIYLEKSVGSIVAVIFLIFIVGVLD